VNLPKPCSAAQSQGMSYNYGNLSKPSSCTGDCPTPSYLITGICPDLVQSPIRQGCRVITVICPNLPRAHGSIHSLRNCGNLSRPCSAARRQTCLAITGNCPNLFRLVQDVLMSCTGVCNYKLCSVAQTSAMSCHYGNLSKASSRAGESPQSS